MSEYTPPDVYREIFLRLPADSLLRLRSVCKRWCNLIDDPIFVTSHTRNYNFNSDNTLLIRNETGAPLNLINLDSIDYTESARQLIDAIPVKQLIRTDVPRLRDLPTTSCNGLILISSYEVNKIWAIWNPLTRECRQLPPPPVAAFGDSTLITTGLGYDNASDDYKAVRIDGFIRNGIIFEKRTLVYSVKLGRWKTIRDIPYDFERGISAGVFLNGALHWHHGRNMIVALNLSTEDYRKLALPPDLLNEKVLLVSSVLRFDAVGGCLTFCHSAHDRDICCVWVMKDYEGGVWTKLFTFDHRRCIFWMGLGGPIRLIAYLERKGEIILQRDRVFLWYDIENGDVKQVSIQDHMSISSQICPGSLYRLVVGDGVVSGNVGTTTGSKKRKRKSSKEKAKNKVEVLCRKQNTWACSDYSCSSSSPPP